MFSCRNMSTKYLLLAGKGGEGPDPQAAAQSTQPPGPHRW